MRKKRFMSVSSGIMFAYLFFIYTIMIVRGYVNYGSNNVNTMYIYSMSQTLIIGLLVFLNIACFLSGLIMLYKFNKAIGVHIGAGLNTVTDIVIGIETFGSDMSYVDYVVSMLILPCIMCAVYFLGCRFVKEEKPQSDRFNLYSIGIGIAVTQSVILSMLYESTRKHLLISFVTLGISVAYFFVLLVWFLHSVNKLTPIVSNIIVGILTIGSILCVAISALSVDLDLGETQALIGNCLWICILCILAAAYYIIYFALVRTGKFFASKTDYNTRQNTQNLEEQMRMLSELNRLRIDGILTEEEFKKEKDKIMGDK